jgi:CRP/FNR family transcriptional regulator/CRP/FNR family cyclic AMP-dependent transcriptional regulator
MPMITEKESGRIAEELAKISKQSDDGKLYKKGEIIYQPGDEDDSIYYIKEGRVKLAYLDESGRKLTLAILGGGEIFGEMVLVGQRRRELLAQAIEDSRIYEIEKGRFLELIQREPWLALKVLELFGQRTREIERKLEDLVFKDIPTRLSRQLLKLIEEHGRRTPEGIEISFKITHKELADMIGSARENTTSALNLLEREGILDKRRYRIIIKDEERLREKSRAL